MSEDAGMTAEEERLRQLRAKWKRQKQEQRQRQAEVRAKVADKRGTATVPPMPEGLRATRNWVRAAHDLFSDRKITSQELQEVRRSAQAVGDLHRVGADLRKAEAALRSAAAQERMAETLAAVEHGSTALVMLARLQESLSLTDGPRRPLPRPRAVTVVPVEAGQ